MRRELKNAHSEKGHGPAPQEMFLLRGEEQPLEHSSTQGGKAETLWLFTRGLQTLLLQKTPKSQLGGQRPAGGACTTTPSCRAHPVPTGDGSTGWAPHVLGVALPTRVTARRDAVPPATPVEAGAEAQPGVHPEARPHPTPSPAPREAGTPGRSGEGGRKDASPASTEEERERLQEAGARPSPRQRSLEENREREKGQARREAQLPAPRGAPRRPLPTAGRRGSCRLQGSRRGSLPGPPAPSLPRSVALQPAALQPQRRPGHVGPGAIYSGRKRRRAALGRRSPPHEMLHRPRARPRAPQRCPRPPGAPRARSARGAQRGEERGSPAAVGRGRRAKGIKRRGRRSCFVFFFPFKVCNTQRCGKVNYPSPHGDPKGICASCLN